MRKLRDLGIYRPPGGQRPVYAMRNGDGYFLYDAQYGALLPPRFKVTGDGEVLDWHGEPARWTVEDLADMGETHRR